MAFNAGMPILAADELRGEGDANYWGSMRQVSRA